MPRIPPRAGGVTGHRPDHSRPARCAQLSGQRAQTRGSTARTAQMHNPTARARSVRPARSPALRNTRRATRPRMRIRTRQQSSPTDTATRAADSPGDRDPRRRRRRYPPPQCPAPRPDGLRTHRLSRVLLASERCGSSLEQHRMGSLAAGRRHRAGWAQRGVDPRMAKGRSGVGRTVRQRWVTARRAALTPSRQDDTDHDGRQW
jgi:hypothetical protein